MEPSLFYLDDSSSEADEQQPRRLERAPLAVRMRPRSLDEVLGQDHLLAPGSPLRVLAGGSQGPAGPSSLILWGPPGTGKTTLAQALGRAPGRKFVELSALRAGVKEVREVMDQALLDRDLRGLRTILFLDEIHRFSRAQQDSLLPGVENGWVLLVAATTENPHISIISPLLSRSILLTLNPLTEQSLGQLLDQALVSERGLGGQVELSPEARNYLLTLAAGDARRALTALEAAAAQVLARQDQEQGEGPALLDLPEVQQALNSAVTRYDRSGDQHYDVTSAFIKSIRGSDVDAALHYLARMIEGGEDPRFIARRLIVHASEDIGLADPTALTAAINAAQAVALVGLPEARLNLAQATIHLSLAPKSNATYRAIDQALADVKAGKAGPVPLHLRDSHYPGAQSLGHGRGYLYPHDQPQGVARQAYAPQGLETVSYYQPSGIGQEAQLGQRLARIKALLRRPGA